MGSMAHGSGLIFKGI